MFYNQQNRCGCGCGNKTTSNCGCRRNSNRPEINCEPLTYAIRPECASTPLDVSLVANTNCALCCEFITYTLTITNNCTSTLTNPILNFELGDSLCFRRNSLAVNGTVKENVICLKNLQLDNLEAGATVTVTLEARVMTNDRYVVSHAVLDYSINCCCSTRCFRTISNGSLVQVCQCCCSPTQTTTTPPAEDTTTNTTEPEQPTPAN